MNQVAIQGRLVREPELRKTQSDVSVVNFSVAVERDFKDRDTGERTADFLDVVAWRYTAEFVSNYIHKGDMVVVTGRIQNNRYTDKDGNNRVRNEIQADNVYSVGSRQQSGNSTANAHAERKQESTGQRTQYAGDRGQIGGYANNSGFSDLTESTDDDLPF